MDEVVPVSVRELLRERIQALEQLEVLLLLQSAPSRWWSAGELAAQLHISEPLSEAALAHLSHHAFLAADTSGAVRYRYAPREPALADAVALLDKSYQDDRAQLLALISSDAVGRVRRRARQLMNRIKGEL